MTTGNKNGRPPIFDTPEELEAVLDNYLKECEATGEPITLTGVCIAFGFSSKQSFYDYEKKDGFLEPIKKARLMVENAYEKRLHGNSPTGSIFALKNMDWKDQRQIDANVVATEGRLTDEQLEAIASSTGTT